jgi:uncharacterized protein YggL (DUF469 family)
MANRSRRLRKKLRVDEFQEMGFDISFNFPVGTAEETIDAGRCADRRGDRTSQAGLRRLGSPWPGKDGLHQQLGKCTDEDRSAVQTWLQGKGLEAVVVTELFDLWYGEPA